MSAHNRWITLGVPLLGVALAAPAQEAMHGDMEHAPAASAVPHDHGRQPAAGHENSKGMSVSTPMDMPMAPHAHEGSHANPHAHGHAMPARADARSADYSEGLDTVPAMAHAQPLLAKVMLDRVEAGTGAHGAGQAWEAQAWFGTPLDKLWLRSEGERERGRLHAGDIEALWSHATSAFWDAQLGVRHDFGIGVRRDWLAFGVQGLAPYWFELAATAYLSANGRTALRVRASRDWRFTQRLILEPEAEINLYGRHDRSATGDVNDASIGLRLRYEFDPKFAPYIGVAWDHRFGPGVPGVDTGVQWVAGLRAWF